MAITWRQSFARYQKYFLNIRAVYEQRPDVRMFLEILLSLSAISAFILLALRPTLLTITNLLTEIKNKEETVTLLNQKIQDLNQAQANYQAQQTTLGLLTTAMPSDPIPEAYVRQIEGLATKNNVLISGISTSEISLAGKPKPQKEDKSLKALPAGTSGFTLALSATGDYSALVSFLRDIENTRRPIQIDAINFSAFKVNEAQKLVLSLQGRVVYEK